jgi:hypothetical protein
MTQAGRPRGPSYRRRGEGVGIEGKPPPRPPTTVIMAAFAMSHRPIPFTATCTPRPVPTPWGSCPTVKGSKALAGEKGYGLKMPQRPIKIQGFEGWPTDGFNHPRAPPEQGRGDGWVHQRPAPRRARHGHPDPHPSLDSCAIHDFSLKKGNKPSGPVERT